MAARRYHPQRSSRLRFAEPPAARELAARVALQLVSLTATDDWSVYAVAWVRTKASGPTTAN
eukprot:scaffold1504_cov111-Isochrysis_galbana.AAC.11